MPFIFHLCFYLIIAVVPNNIVLVLVQVYFVRMQASYIHVLDNYYIENVSFKMN